MANKLDGLYVDLEARISGFQASLRTAAGSLSTWRSKAEADANSFNASLNRLRNTVLSLSAAWGIFRVGKSIVDAGMQMQALQNRMAAATMSTTVAADAMAYARAQAERLGLDFRATADGFAGFSAATLRAGLTLDETKTIFTGVSEAAAALHLSTERVGLVFTALSQMANKGKVTMEELSQQLGDSLPGALAIFSKAMGVSTAEFTKMVSNGQVLVPDLIKLGNELHNQFGERAVTAAQSAQAAFARFGNAVFDLKLKFANGGFLESVTQSVRDLTAALNDPNTQQGLAAFAAGLATIATKAAEAVAGLSNLAVSAGRWAGNTIVGALGLDQAGADLPKELKDRIASRGYAAPSLVNGRVATGQDETVSGSYTLGKVSKPGPSASVVAAQNARARLRDRVDTMREGLISESDPNKAQSAKALADLSKRYEEEQNLLQKALEKKAITQQEFNEASLETELDYQSRLAEIRQQYREQFLSDEEAAAEGFLGVQIGYQNKSVVEQGKGLRASLQQAAQHNKAAFLLEKAAAIAQALLSARQSVVDAYKWGTKLGGPALGAAFAGVAAAAQAANIAAIASTSFDSGGGSVGSTGGGGDSGGSSQDSTAPASSTPAAPEKKVFITLEGTIFDTNTVRTLIEQINDAISDGSTLKVAVA